jgi:hypothetical protein
MIFIPNASGRGETHVDEVSLDGALSRSCCRVARRRGCVGVRSMVRIDLRENRSEHALARFELRATRLGESLRFETHRRRLVEVVRGEILRANRKLHDDDRHTRKCSSPCPCSIPRWTRCCSSRSASENHYDVHGRGEGLVSDLAGDGREAPGTLHCSGRRA